MPLCPEKKNGKNGLEKPIHALARKNDQKLKRQKIEEKFPKGIVKIEKKRRHVFVKSAQALVTGRRARAQEAQYRSFHWKWPIT